MSVSVLDAAVTFQADTTQTDAAFDQLPGKAEASFGEASKFAQQFQGALDATGENVDLAGEKLLTLGQAFRTLSVTGPEHLKQQLDLAKTAFQTLQEAGVTAQGTLLQATIKVTERQIAYNKALGDSTVGLQKQLVDLQGQYSGLGGAAEKGGEAAVEAGGKASESFHEASGAAILLSDTIGVRMSRELRGIASQLPGIGLLLQAAFIPTAIFGFIEVLVSASEKIEEFIEKPRLIEEAWRSVGDSFSTVDRSLTSSLDSAQAKIIGLTQGPIAEMDFEIKHLGTDALQVAGYIGQIGDSLNKAFKADEASKFNPLSWWNDSSRDVAKEATIFFNQLQSNITQLGNAGGLVAVKTQIQEVGIQIADVNSKITKEAGGAATGLFQDRLAALEQYKAKLLEVQGVIERGQQIDADDAQVKILDKRREAGELAAAQAKRDLDTELAAVDTWKAGVQSAFLSGATDAATWAAAQVRAADQADTAQEAYLSRLITVYKQSGDVVKEQATIQELATLQVKDASKEVDTLAAAIQKHNEFALGMVKSWADLQSQNVAKTWNEATKAAQELVLAQNKLGEAQKNLALANTNAQYAEQINQIEALASAGVISEEEKAQKLRAIYEEEGRDQLASLNLLLRQQQDAITVAQAKLDQAKDNPFFSDAQLENLQANLDKAVTVYTNTQTQIVSEQQRSATQLANIDNQTLKSATASWNGYFKAIVAGSLTSGQAIRSLGVLTAQGIGASVTAAVSGASSFGQAMEQMLKSALAQLAGVAVVQAIEEIARGFSDLAKAASAAADPFTAALAPGFVVAAHTHFLAAAKWGAVGAGAAIGGALIPSGSDSSTSASGSGADQTQAASPVTTAAPSPIQVQNIQRFASGALVSKRTVAMLGDSSSGGDAVEGVLPLEDDRAMERIAGAIAVKIGISGDRVYQLPQKGWLDLGKLAKQLSRGSNRATLRLHASTSTRTIRRS